MTVYISGPVTGKPDYQDCFLKAEYWLKLNGYTVINPARVNAELPKGTSHLEYMRVSLAMLQNADAIFMLSGWEMSRGAHMELGYAVASEMKIMYEVEMPKL